MKGMPRNRGPARKSHVRLRQVLGMRSLLLLAVTGTLLLAGCAGSATAPDAMYLDADHRFSGVATEAFSQTEKIQLDSGEHTLLIAVQSDDGFAVSFQGPPRREPYSGMMLPSAQHGFGLFGEVAIQDLRYTTWDTQGGTWTLTFGCEGPCIYTVAINENNTVPSLPHLPATPKAAAARGELVDDSDEITFQVPAVPEHLKIAMDFMTDEAISFRILDPEGTTAGVWNFNEVYARGWSYQSRADDLQPGDWTLRVDCDGTCQFDIGVV